MIVVGADTPEGMEIAAGLAEPDREVRVFVTDPARGAELRSLGLKVALGDVSDEGHVGAAATRCFSAVLITAAATDGREISFAEDGDQVLEGWARAVTEAEVSRVIWVTDQTPPPVGVTEVAIVDPGSPDLAERVLALDDARKI